jgi:hypothetical protein
MPAIRSLGAFSMVILLAAHPVLADCVEETVRDLHPGTALSIRRADGSVERGTFLSVESDPLRLLIEKHRYSSRRAAKTLELATSEITEIDYVSTAHFDGKWMLLGTVGGGFLCAALAQILKHDTEFSTVVANSPIEVPAFGFASPGPVGRSAKVGMALGLVIGTLVGAGRVSHHRSRCPEVSSGVPTRVQSPPDSLQALIR